RVGALPGPIPRLEERRLGFATGVAQFPCQRDCLAENIVAALRVIEAVGEDTRPNQRIETHFVACRVQGQRPLEPRPALGEMAADIPELSQRTGEPRV